MDFNDFYKLLPKIKNLPLPGEESHFKMAPALRKKHLAGFDLSVKNPKRAGVLSLFYPDKHLEARLLLILRKTYAGVHSNQVGFPGGRYEEADSNLAQTALRETMEEVGVSPEKVELIKELSELYIPPSNFLVQPFIGVSKGSLSFKIQEEEVESVIEVSLRDFLDQNAVFQQKLKTSYAESVEVPAYNLNGYTVWGATAMMLSEVKDLLMELM